MTSFKEKMAKDPDYLLKLERSIAREFGEETIKSPKESWTEEQERAYREQVRAEFYRKKNKEVVEIGQENGFLVEKKLFNKDKKVCPRCNKYSFSSKDDLFLNKFDCCERCYILYFEDRNKREKR